MRFRRPKLKQVLVALFTLAVFGIGGNSYITDYLPRHQARFAQSAQLAALLSAPEQPLELGVKTQFSDCQAVGPLPDPECTPGAVFPEATKEDICVSGYSKTVRNVSVSLKKKIFAEYNISYPVPFGSYEIDHLIPLALGGSNEVSNLWPKSAEPFPGFFEKNVTGNFLHEEVCAGRISLVAAQQQIAKDWFSVYNSLAPEVVADYKRRYPNWAARNTGE